MKKLTLLICKTRGTFSLLHDSGLFSSHRVPQCLPVCGGY